MIERAFMPRLRQQLEEYPCVLLLGARQVGKSNLAASLAKEKGDAAIMINLAEPDAVPILQAPQEFLTSQVGRLVIFDEAHTSPAVLNQIRGQVALRVREGYSKGQFLLLGDSHSLRELISDSLTGMVAILELPPLQPFEIPETHGTLIDDEVAIAEVTAMSGPDSRELESRLWVRGGMPGSYLALNEQASYAWRRQFVQAVIARGITVRDQAIPFETCERAWLTLARNHGNEVPWNELGSCLGGTKVDVERFIGSGCDHRDLRFLERWYASDKKRYFSRRKLYLGDTGLLHAHLKLRDYDAVLSHDIKGKSWEGHVLESIINASAPGVEPYYFKTEDEAGEIDIVVARDNRKWAIEAKLGDRPKLTPAFYRAIEDLKPERTIAIYRGSDRYTKNRKVDLMNLRDAIREIATF